MAISLNSKVLVFIVRKEKVVDNILFNLKLCGDSTDLKTNKI